MCVCVCVCLCVFLDWENQYCENVYTITILFYTIQSNLQTQCNFYQLTNGMSHRIRTHFTICMGTQMTLDSQNNIANKMNNIDEVDRFSERYNLPTVNQEKIKYMNIPITSSIVSPLGNLTWPSPSQVRILVKNPPAMQETPVQSLGREVTLETRKSTHTRILAWRIPWTVYSIRSDQISHSLISDSL